MIGIVHLGQGNVGSVVRALRRMDIESELLETPRLEGIHGLIFPGVGNFKVAAEELDRRRWRTALLTWVKDDRPLLGICLGYQLMYEGSTESPGTEGLGLFPGQCDRVPSEKQPHMGWNRLLTETPNWAGYQDSWMYFVHGFVPPVGNETVLQAQDGGVAFAAGAERSRTLGVQFHPEKSSRDGSRFLSRFVEGLPC
ncbi:MAG: imidazole glycerol phosphate synthase subunit HisH [Candidatus Eisenbacteria bacterium]|uniref:Imidazole glycerol phosphate synthase subunit HisH n=1 Tax=Eiseniibacteriota bacterium TaxID=2212470 RepID=A0A7Y2EAN4_UNCEI|nr:imidazole glycerol phosphate synthase subunit HisH [Candidatus Eisenbacteria bacterium]